MMQADFISPDDKRWKDFLSGTVHDIFHLPDYSKVSVIYETGEPLAFWAQSGKAELLIPLIIRKIPKELNPEENLFDAVSPYGYPAPLFKANGEREAVLEDLLGKFKSFSRERNFVSAFVRFNPVLPFPHGRLGAMGKLVTLGETVLVDLKLSEEELRTQLRRDHRSNVRGLERKGFVFEINNWDRLDDFIRIYEETMTRVSASSYYFFDKKYFEALRECLGDHIHLASVISPSGEVAAASLFTETCGIVQYFLSGTTKDYLRVAPTKLMLWKTILWARSQGFRVLHLGGGVGASRDSLFEFKKGFSKLYSEFNCLRVVFDEKQYQILSKRAAVRGRVADENYFPEYREG